MITIIKLVNNTDGMKFGLYSIVGTTETFVAMFPTREQALKAAQIYALKKD